MWQRGTRTNGNHRLVAGTIVTALVVCRSPDDLYDHIEGDEHTGAHRLPAARVAANPHARATSAAAALEAVLGAADARERLEVSRLDDEVHVIGLNAELEHPERLAGRRRKRAPDRLGSPIGSQRRKTCNGTHGYVEWRTRVVRPRRRWGTMRRPGPRGRPAPGRWPPQPPKTRESCGCRAILILAEIIAGFAGKSTSVSRETASQRARAASARTW
jgi:hypothetical protein